jgi:arylsulfatase A-like enzyme
MKTNVLVIGMILGMAIAGKALPVGAAAPQKPNIVFIFGDDCGIDSFGCYGSDRAKTFTPNIDALAQAGTRFERGYSTPLCGTSRCLIMTGRYGFRTGGLTNPTAGQPSYKDEPSLAKILKQAGYATGMAGKWRQMSDSPGDWGFTNTSPTPPPPAGTGKTTTRRMVEEVRQGGVLPRPQQRFASAIRRHKDQPSVLPLVALIHGHPPRPTPRKACQPAL